MRAHRVILLGGGTLFAKMVSFSEQNGFQTLPLTSKRHLEGPVGTHQRPDISSAARRVPPRSAGNGLTLREFLAQKKIKHHSLDALEEQQMKKIVGGMDRSVAITLGAPWEISRRLIEKVFAGKIFNCHGTRLPTYRGGAMYSWNILKGNRLGLCLLQNLNETDTGEIIRYEEFVYPASCRVPQDYEAVYAQKNAEFLSKFLLEFRKGPMKAASLGQPEYLSTFYPRLNTNLNGWINWDWPLEEIERFICAFDEPYPGAMTTLGGRTVRLKDVVAQRNDGRNHPYQSGLVYRSNGRWLMVSCGDGELIVQKVLDEKGKDILGGIRAGERFFTPASRLESAKGSAHFSPDGESRAGQSDPLVRFAAGPDGGRPKKK